MRRMLTALTLAAVVAGGSQPASAFMLQLSVGEGIFLNSPKVGSSVSAAPLTTEILGGFNVGPYLTLDVGFLFAYDVFEPYYGTTVAQSYYLGVRPGIHVFLSRARTGLVPYLRAAFPIEYDNATGNTFVGLLLGGGVEFKLGFVGVFAEGIISPYFNNQNPVPLEARIGVAVHF